MPEVPQLATEFATALAPAGTPLNPAPAPAPNPGAPTIATASLEPVASGQPIKRFGLRGDHVVAIAGPKRTAVHDLVAEQLTPLRLRITGLRKEVLALPATLEDPTVFKLAKALAKRASNIGTESEDDRKLIVAEPTRRVDAVNDTYRELSTTPLKEIRDHLQGLIAAEESRQVRQKQADAKAAAEARQKAAQDEIARVFNLPENVAARAEVAAKALAAKAAAVEEATRKQAQFDSAGISLPIAHFLPPTAVGALPVVPPLPVETPVVATAPVEPVVAAPAAAPVVVETVAGLHKAVMSYDGNLPEQYRTWIPNRELIQADLDAGLTIVGLVVVELGTKEFRQMQSGNRMWRDDRAVGTK